jgi:hypothetical protein
VRSFGSAAQHNTAQHGTAQHSTAQHSTAQHSTAEWSGIYALACWNWGDFSAFVGKQRKKTLLKTLLKTDSGASGTLPSTLN